MLKIGVFSKLSRVSIRMLRYYDRLGLLQPIWVDPVNGYRSYSMSQLSRVRQILALKDLGFRLEEIVGLLADDESANLCQMLQRRRTELRDQIAADHKRLVRIEARLQALEQEQSVSLNVHTAFFTELIRQQYGLVATLEPDPDQPDADWRRYRVHSQHQDYWLYVGRSDGLADGVYCTWLTGYAGRPATDWLLGRAGLLIQLERFDICAPRLVLTEQGAPLGSMQGWSALLTTALAGHPAQEDRATMRALGEALGQLHTLPTGPEGQNLPIGMSWFYPEHALDEAIYHLHAAQAHVPLAWHSTLNDFRSILQSIQRAQLPRGLIYADGWVGRGIWLDEQRFGLQEWHTSGLGVIILDLGRLLLGCHWSAGNTVADSIVPNHERIHAVLDGYLRYRTLLPEERRLLLEAICFSIGYGSAEHIAHAATSGWTPKLQGRLARRQQWYQASEEIARIADGYLG